MPSWKSVLVKPRTGTGEGGAGQAILVPMDASAAADPASEAAEGYVGVDGKPLLTRTIPRKQLAAHLNMIEELVYDGSKHKSVQSGQIADAGEEVKRLNKICAEAFKVGELPSAESVAHSVAGEMSWSSDEARLAAMNSHEGVAKKSMEVLLKAKKTDVHELLRIASHTKHPSVALDAVVAAVDLNATREQLIESIDTIKHSDAAMMAFEVAKGLSKKK
jgi:nucleotide-binding universal stress UspA family protein